MQNGYGPEINFRRLIIITPDTPPNGRSTFSFLPCAEMRALLWRG